MFNRMAFTSPRGLPPFIQRASHLTKIAQAIVQQEERDPAFDRVVALATRLLDAPIAMVTFLDETHVWYKAKTGINVISRPRSEAFCTWAPGDGSLLVVDDLTTDPRFSDNPWVTGPSQLRFTAIAPIHEMDGTLLGAVCVLDTEPRTLTADDEACLLMLRDMTMEALHLRASLRAYADLLESISDAFFALDDTWQFTYINQQAEVLLDRSRNDLLGKNVWQEFPEAVDLPFYTHYHHAVETGEQVSFEAYFPPLETWFRVTAYPFEDGLSVYFNDVTEEVEQATALQEREQYLSIMLRSIGDAVITTDAEGCIREMNVVAEELTGWVVEEAKGKPLTTVFPIHNAQTGKSVESPVAKVLRLGGIVGMANHTVLTAKDDTLVQIADSAAPILNEEGDLLGIVMVFRDVTEEYEQRAREDAQRRQFELALRGGDLGLWDWDMNTGKVRYNDRWAEMLGYAPESLQGTVDDFSRRAHPEDAERVFDMIARHAAGDIPFLDIEVRMQANDGSWRWILDRGQVVEWNDDGTPARAVGTHMDITQRKEREALLRAREQQLQTLYDAMSTLAAATTSEAVAEHLLSLITDTLKYPVSVVRLWRDGQLEAVAVSEQAHELLPTPRPSYTTDDAADAVRAWQSEETVVVPSVVASERSADLGTIQSAAYIPLPSFGVISVASTVVDGVAQFDIELLELLAQNASSVLQRIAQEDDLREARDQAEEMNRLKTAFLANMSHEIRTPLTSILGFAEMLSEMDFEEPANDFTHRIQRSSHRLLETLTSVLDLSQLEAGAMKLSPRIFVLQEVIEDAVHGFSRRVADKEITLDVKLPDEPVEVYQDRAALQRVVTNLVSNAVKFTLEGGVTVRVHLDDAYVVLEVRDTGVGIGDAFLPHLFEPFVQESSGSGRGFEGTGLGLAITRDLVRLMQGEISVDSIRSEGTTFTVRIPLRIA